MRHGTRLGIDVGRARVGVARSDAAGLLATPLATLPREQAIAEIARLVEEFEVMECVVGLPISLAGHDTPSTTDARAFAGELTRHLDVPIRIVDERLSTVSATRQLQGGGVRAKNQRQIIDQAAAVIILQHSLDVERAQGSAPGTLLSEVD